MNGKISACNTLSSLQGFRTPSSQGRSSMRRSTRCLGSSRAQAEARNALDSTAFSNCRGSSRYGSSRVGAMFYKRTTRIYQHFLIHLTLNTKYTHNIGSNRYHPHLYIQCLLDFNHGMKVGFICPLCSHALGPSCHWRFSALSTIFSRRTVNVEMPIPPMIDINTKTRLPYPSLMGSSSQNFGKCILNE